MLVQIGNWLYQNAMAIFISAIASLLISKRYYDKANRESVLMMVIFPIVKLLNEKYYTRNDYEALFEINSSYAIKYLRKKERNKLLELLSAYRDVCKYSNCRWHRQTSVRELLTAEPSLCQSVRASSL